MAVSIDVPQRKRLAVELTGSDDRFRVLLPKSSLELIGSSDAIIHHPLGQGDEGLVIARVHDQGGRHAATPLARTRPTSSPPWEGLQNRIRRPCDGFGAGINRGG
jgi:hypothetical protein